MRATPALFLALLFLLVLPAHADVHPNTAPGFPADQSFHVGDVDNVNLFNGALTLTIPLGGSYPVNGGFSYGLKLTYNANPWEFITTTIVFPDGSEASQRLAFPNGCSNAGLGFRISLGRLDPPCHGEEMHEALYQDENGTDHILYPTLHDGDPEDAPISGVTKVLYTRDGTYLRLKVFSSGMRQLEFPDGSLRQFNSSGLPELILDPFGNSLTISYATPNQWVLSDSQGRTHRVFFRTDLPDWSAPTVDRVELAAFGGTTATYQFGYNMQAVGRVCPNSDTSLGNTVTVPLLTLLTLPDGSSYHNTVNDYVIAPPSNGLCTEHSGNLLGLNLPTEGRLEWSWQTYRFNQSSTSKPYLQRSSGVATRTMRDNNGVVLGTWSYATAITPNLSNQEQTTTVTDPLGHRTVNFFSTSMTPSFTGWSKFDYSLPFTRAQTLNVAPGVDLNLSRQTFNSAGTLLRSEYVLYERDPNPMTAAPSDAPNTNRRVVRSRTVFQDDGGNFAGVVNSDFDGLGHYRQQQTEGSLPGSNVRTHFGNYNPARGTYVVDQAANTGSGFTVFPPGTPWVTETMTFMSNSEGGATAQTDLCYAPNSTAVVRQRVHRLDGVAQGAADLVTVNDLDVAGNVVSEKSYGGDSQAVLPTGGVDLCTMTLPASPKYQVDHTYAFGARATSRYAGTSHFILNQGIDASTGLVSASTDSAGLTTFYEYDRLGRMTWSKPQTGHGGWTEAVYTPALGLQRALVNLRHRDNGSKSAPVLQSEFLLFDGFGRIFQEQRQLPSGQVNKRETLYDGAGNKASVSELATGTPSNRTQFLNYDPFGRPGILRPPDGAGHDVTMTYLGARQVDRTVKIATSTGTETAATTTEVYDRHGRLLSVTEPSGASGANVTTTYGYDVGNRLSSVSTTAASTTQNRAFNYDRAGLLTSETHPEKGSSGNGSVSYPQYDARGHALRKIDGLHDLTFVYDAAERLTLVRETGGAQRSLKAFSYAGSNGFNDFSQGKLRQADRFNYVTLAGSPFTVQVTETYTYGGRDGRISQRNTAVTTTPATNPTSGTFTQGFAYNALGQVSSLDYPVCTHPDCTMPVIFTGDVPADHPDRAEIEAIFPGVTAGCGGNFYCPDGTINRATMAVYLLKGKEGPDYTPPPCTTPMFTDVPCSDPFAKWINELARRGITAGCGGGNYCPQTDVTNAQMAVFLLATLGVSPPACTSPPFLDVACNSFAAAWIAEEARRGIMPGCGGSNFCPNATTTRAKMAGMITRAFDIPVPREPHTSRTAQFSYAQGLLTTVSAGGVTYGTLSYHPNLLVSQIAHGNGLTETQSNDPNDMRRPAALSATGAFAAWSSGTYAYDGAGNVKAIGTSSFTYDQVSRLVSSSLFDGTMGGGNLKQQSYAFDAFGNITSITTNGVLRNTPTSATTNRLTGVVNYDSAGNLTSWNGAATYEYDAFNQMIHMTSGSEDWAYLYTADDERIWSYDISRNASRWTLRDLGGKVLREYQNNQGRWGLATDYFYRDGLLLAAETLTGRRHYHLDHLGTPRLLTRASGYPAAYHVYYPFGEEATALNQDTERMKFTGHERDLASLAGAGDDLDYMHARHESPVTGRFLATDKADFLSLQFGDEDDQRRFHEFLVQPQNWNRYNYTKGNPLKYVDSDGESAELALGSTLALGGESGASASSLAAGLNPVGAVVLAGAGGVLVGTALNQIPAVRNAIQAGFGAIFDGISLAQNTRHSVAVATGNIAQALAHLEKISTAGGPGKDPDFKHHQKEIKTFLENAKRAARRLPGKLRDAYLKAIEAIADKAGVTL